MPEKQFDISRDDLAPLFGNAALLGHMQLESGEAAQALRQILAQLKQGDLKQAQHLRNFLKTPAGRALAEQAHTKLVAKKHPLFSDLASATLLSQPLPRN